MKKHKKIELVKRGLQMPGAVCGMWGVCGAVSSMGAALSIIDKNDVELQSDKIECHFSEKKKVAFICVHNSCRSQIAEALGKHLASDVFESYSAGTETKPQINQDAVRIMKELYGIDMEQAQHSKLISDIPNPDVAISMGCNVVCRSSAELLMIIGDWKTLPESRMKSLGLSLRK